MSIQPRKLVLEFTKMSGTGNDFIVVDNRFYHFSAEELSQMASSFCPRRTGIGADGLLALGKALSEEAHYRMTYYNADGTLGTMCGNGARCLARFAREAGIDANPLLFDSDAGLYRAQAGRDVNNIRLFVPEPRDFEENISIDTKLPDGSFGEAHFLWTGTEHLVVPVKDVDSIDVSSCGASLRSDPRLGKKGANINFVQRLNNSELKVRTFEKGVEAETLACGTGSIAAVIVSHLTGVCTSVPVSVHMRGGILRVGFEGESNRPVALYLEGGADVVYRGTIEI